eukprot:gene3048-3598_t
MGRDAGSGANSETRIGAALKYHMLVTPRANMSVTQKVIRQHNRDFSYQGLAARANQTVAQTLASLRTAHRFGQFGDHTTAEPDGDYLNLSPTMDPAHKRQRQGTVHHGQGGRGGIRGAGGNGRGNGYGHGTQPGGRRPSPTAETPHANANRVPDQFHFVSEAHHTSLSVILHPMVRSHTPYLHHPANLPPPTLRRCSALANIRYSALALANCDATPSLYTGKGPRRNHAATERPRSVAAAAAACRPLTRVSTPSSKDIQQAPYLATVTCER